MKSARAWRVAKVHRACMSAAVTDGCSGGESNAYLRGLGQITIARLGRCLPSTVMLPPSSALDPVDTFARRTLGTTPAATAEMLRALG